MQSLARKLSQTSAEMTFAEVVEVKDGTFVVQEEAITYDALRAVSCLVAPQVADQVLVFHGVDGASYILAVLVRHQEAPARLEFEGDVELHAPSGKVDLVARDGVNVASPQEINLTAPSLNLSSEVGRVVIENLTLAGKIAQASVQKAKLTAKSTETFVGQAIGRFKARFNKVEELDQQQAGTLKQDVKEAHIMSNKYTLLRAKKDVKIDGEQIIMG